MDPAKSKKITELYKSFNITRVPIPSDMQEIMDSPPSNLQSQIAILTDKSEMEYDPSTGLTSGTLGGCRPKEPLVKPIAKSSERRTANGYIDYIQSEEFESEHPSTVIQTCISLAAASNLPKVFSFWKSHESILQALIEDNQTVYLRNILTEVKRGPEHASSFMRGLDTGIALEKNRSHSLLIYQLGKLYESMAKMHALLKKEQSTQVAQSIEFAKQITSASEDVSEFKKNAETLKLMIAKMAAMPFPISTSPGPLDDTVSLTSEMASSSLSRQKVIELRDDGVYSNDWAVVKVQNQQISSIEGRSSAASHLTALIGLPIIIAALVLNRNMRDLMRLISKDPSAFKSAMNISDGKEKENFVRIIESVSPKTHQWMKETTSE